VEIKKIFSGLIGPRDRNISPFSLVKSVFEAFVSRVYIRSHVLPSLDPFSIFLIRQDQSLNTNMQPDLFSHCLWRLVETIFFDSLFVLKKLATCNLFTTGKMHLLLSSFLLESLTVLSQNGKQKLKRPCGNHGIVICRHGQGGQWFSAQFGAIQYRKSLTFITPN
jgi:hypothetical protein